MFSGGSSVLIFSYGLEYETVPIALFYRIEGQGARDLFRGSYTMKIQEFRIKKALEEKLKKEAKLRRFVNWYNWVKPHKGIGNLTSGEKLLEYFYPEKL